MSNHDTTRAQVANSQIASSAPTHDSVFRDSGRRDGGRRKGQAAIIIALSMLVLIMIVGLAVDGGSIYVERRTAQNATDAAAAGSTRVMLDAYDSMTDIYPDYDVDGTMLDDQNIRASLVSWAAQHHVAASDLHAYYVNYDKQIVSNTEVGSFGAVPWTSMGAAGIAVRGRAETDTFFMKLFGWNKVGAQASSTAFMGVVGDSGKGLPLMPIGFFTDTVNIDSLVISRTYTLISGDSTNGAGAWGYLNYNGNGNSTQTIQAWIHCGFNPAVTTSQWASWVQSQGCESGGYINDSQAAGPTQHYTCAPNADGSPDPTCSAPNPNPYYVPYVRWGRGDKGWWIDSSTGATLSVCHDLQDLVGSHPGVPLWFPLIDRSTGGSNTKYHIAGFGLFRMDGSSVVCNGRGGDHWNIRGTYMRAYVPGSSGQRGNLRTSSGRTVFLDN